MIVKIILNSGSLIQDIQLAVMMGRYQSKLIRIILQITISISITLTVSFYVILR
ncbi:hypothetical protein NADFUDRAFT_79247 [Nadsonia fulvescens var. elongata DSM 6958]|uniref:Uncharacterized protein n=1 Tax=Nadsonia fulvescens var. elongata DSM 6958 TaxID=857566 RepID=A0A1E3PIS9_9ASCO|nr:hypothetical protein NADFUDRAFT_79247 [Nadsonia fulvescens var. elongata DSM 6958]